MIAKERLCREQTTIRLPGELHQELTAIAKQMGLTLTAVLLVAIWWSVLRLRGQPQ